MNKCLLKGRYQVCAYATNFNPHLPRDIKTPQYLISSSKRKHYFSRIFRENVQLTLIETTIWLITSIVI